MMNAKWVTTKRACEIFGFTEYAINAKRKTGKWQIKKHWIKRDGKIFICIEEINKWIEGK
jgi:hypothetical protein